MDWSFKIRPGSLSGKFAASVIFFSSLIALVITAAELTYDFTRDVRQIDSRMTQIQDTYLASITENVWVFDKERINTLLLGITRLPDFVLAEVRINGKVEMRQGSEAKGAGVTHAFTLERMHQGRKQVIGELVVVATYEGAYARVMERAALFLLANGAKTLLVAFFIVFIFYRLIGRHVENISRYAHDHSSPDEAPALVLNRIEPQRADELSELVAAFNHQRKQLLKFSREEARRAEVLEERVALRTAELEAKQQALLVAKDEAEWASRAKSHFLASMSHELRTPLNAIMGFAQMLEMSVQKAANKESLHFIVESSRQLLKLVDDVLQLTNSEARQIHYQLEAVDVDGVLQECLEAYQSLAQGRGMHLTRVAEASPAGHWVRADRRRLKQAVLNYVSNAIKYGRDGGNIRLQAIRRDGLIRLAVADDGAGIPAERKLELFTPFNRLGHEGSNVLGAGLGLSVTKEVVELMGGQVGAQSEEGRGAIFWIELPATTPGLACEAG